jgi:hypothetical protein
MDNASDGRTGRFGFGPAILKILFMYQLRIVLVSSRKSTREYSTFG